MRRWRGLKALVHDAVDATTALVWEGHDVTFRNLRRVTDRLGPVADPGRIVDRVARASTSLTLETIQRVNDVVETLVDIAIDAAVPAPAEDEEPAIPMRSDAFGTPEWVADAALSTLNAAIGHHLAATANGLDLSLELRHDDRYLRHGERLPPAALAVVFVHGLGISEWGWAMEAAEWYGDPATTYGTQLARDLGATAIYVRYNTGRRVGVNGRALSHALEVALADATTIVLVGHSMGGLVARAAVEAGRGTRWVTRVALVVSLGSPNQGATFAQLGEITEAGLGAVDLPTTRILARILAARSAGIRDLEHGEIDDLARDPDATAAPEERVVPLLDGVTYAFFSATMTSDPDHPLGVLLGDLMVRPGSAAGPAGMPASDGFRIETGSFPGVVHHQLMNHPAVYTRLLPLIRRFVPTPA